MSNPCVGCGCCCKYIVEVKPLQYKCDQSVPKELLEESRRADYDVFEMKRDNFGYCIGFDKEKRCCTLYENRPNICRKFEIGCEMCLNAINRIADKKTKSKVHEYIAEQYIGKNNENLPTD